MQIIKEKLESCFRILKKSDRSAFGNINWLNEFCAEFLAFSNAAQFNITNQKEQSSLEVICLCLSQITICIRYLEQTLKAESVCRSRIEASRSHFIDRITICLKRLSVCLEPSNASSNTIEDGSFLKLLDSVLDSLHDFTNYNPDNLISFIDQEELVALTKHMKIQIDLLLGHTLSFANVALQQDKKALSALCQKVMRDCGTFQDECNQKSTPLESNYSNQKLRAMTLENALYQLEDYVNEALLRLVFTSFLDFQKISVDKIRNVLCIAGKSTQTDCIADEFIADFDVNLDRATQIGVFSIAFAPNIKMKTAVRSCLASFEYLDTSLIPSLQADALDLHSELLEEHFKEELFKYKTALYEIIDSRAFVGCYLHILTSGITDAEKQFDKIKLDDLVKMGFFILEHFQLDVNQKVLLEPDHESLKKFMCILCECKAILMCASQVNQDRILKRFKILRTMLRKLHNNIAVDPNGPAAFTENSAKQHSTDIGNELCVSSNLMASPTSSILYNTHKDRTKSKCANINVCANNAKVSVSPVKLKANDCVRRKESLRTAMFKRQNVIENSKFQNTVSSQSASLEITNILDQLTSLTTTFSSSLRIK